MGRLEGKTALVTGAARGLGAAIARRFAGEGAKVIVNDLSLEAAEGVAKELGGHGLAADVSDSTAVAAMFGEVRRLVPRLDILVNNAGISGLEGRNDVEALMARRAKLAQELASSGPVETFIDGTAQTTDAHWRRMLGVHVDGTFFCCREALKIMNPQMAGTIVNISSVMGTFGRPGNVPYSTAKAAVLGLTRALAHEVAPRNIRVNGIAPGWIDTDMTAPLGGPVRQSITSGTPLRRFGEPDDIAWAAVYLASDEAKFMTGQVISPNGGWYMSQ
jgi:3-oxoacyl-[acyl-carrier protein] reductase